MPRMPKLALPTALCALSVLIPIASAQIYSISTYAGGALPVNLPATSASLYGPQSALASDAAGNIFFVDGNTVLKLNSNTGVLTLAAGNGTAGYSGDNGPAVSAQLRDPFGLAVDAAGNLYIAETGNNVVRMVSAGIITTMVGTGTAGFSGDNGLAATAQINAPYGITLDAAGNLYIADNGNSRIREVSGGTITTVAGSGTAGFSGDNGLATTAQISSPHAIAVDPSGDLYIADTANNRIREVISGVIGTIAGNGAGGYFGDGGPATGAQLNVPCGLALDTLGNLYIADYYNNRIRKVSNGVISTFAGKGTRGFSGDNAPATSAQLNNPFALAEDPTGNLFLADYGNNRIRKISAGIISTVVGNGTTGFSGDNGSAVSAQLASPYGVTFDSSGNAYITDYQNNRIRKVSSGIITTVAGNGMPGFAGDNGPATIAQLNQPSGVAVDSSGNIFIADSGNNRVRKVAGGIITTAAGNGTAGFAGDSGPAISAELGQPLAVTLDPSGNLYIADSGNSRVRKVAGVTITTIAGNGTPGFSGDKGSATVAQIRNPSGLSFDSSGNLFIADTGNNRVRKVASGTITTVAGNGTAGFTGDNAAATAAELYAPVGVAANAGNLYIADTGNSVIRKVVAAGTISTVAGGGTSFGDNGLATDAELGFPQAVAMDTSGNIYVADTGDNRIRQLTPIPLSSTGPASLPAGTVGAAYGPVTFTAAGGVGGYSWTAASLPKGLTLSIAGLLGGTPSATNASPTQFTLKDAANANVVISLTLTVNNPIPTITSLSPAAITAYGAAFTLTVNGVGFLPGAAILWNSAPLTTKLVNATQLTASVPAASIGGAGTVSIIVSSGGTTSGSMSLTVNPQPPVLTSINPTSAIATGAALTLTATGTSFAQTDNLQWNGSPLPTTYVSPSQLTAYVTPNLIAAAGTASIAVSAGQASTSAITFTIAAPPTLTGLSPASVIAATAAVTLRLTGTGFAQGAVVQWNGSPIPTTFASATQLTAAVSAAMIQSVANVTDRKSVV